MEGNLQENNNIVEKNNKKNVIIIILVALLVGAICFICYDKFLKNDSSRKENTKDNTDVINTFKYNDDGASGIATVKGYITVEKTDYCVDGECESSENSIYDVTHFHILETESTSFRNYINSFYSNDYTGEKTFSLGCVKNNVISYYNTYDEIQNDSEDNNDFKYFVLSNDVSQKILNSSIDNPITLKLEKKKFSSGSGAPECYSHITNIEIVN